MIFSIQPDDIGAHINVGRTYNNLNISLSAERAFRRAIDLFPPVIKGDVVVVVDVVLVLPLTSEDDLRNVGVVHGRRTS